MEQAVPPISDASKPNAGRIYDYLLGGRHNFEVDRIAARKLLQDVPEMSHWGRLVRWFLGAAIRRLANEGYDKFLDFASGLPTVDHIHHVTPKGTRVVYSDIDPITVAYAREIVNDLPGIAYVQGDAGSPESVLQLPIIEELFGTDRRLAIGFNGIAWFLTDQQLQHALSVIYDWVGPGSKLFICDTNNTERTAQSGKVQEFYDKVTEPLHYRDEQKVRSLLGNWKICEPGLKPLEEWLPIEKKTTKAASQAMGANILGAILEKA